MSTVDTRLAYAEALFAAEKFRDLFDRASYVRWEFAGSVRRRCQDVGDIEHVVEARFADVAGDDLFGSPKRVNLLFRRMDELVSKLSIYRHDYGGGRVKWGDKSRCADASSLGILVQHDVYLADAENWGPLLAIRTGPADFSKQLVTGLLRNGYRQKDGYTWRGERCTEHRPRAEQISFADDGDGRRRVKPGTPCELCDGTGVIARERVSVSDEATFFKLCGIPYRAPESRR
jgi:DNA polymerase/3'-5' exonuclease PolX